MSRKETKNALIESFLHEFQRDDIELGKKLERERIVALLTEIRDNWTKPTSFNYLAELDSIIAKIKTDLPTRTVQKVVVEDQK